MTEPHSKLEKAAENTVLRFLTQMTTPVLLGLIAWLGNNKLESMDAQNESLKAAVAAQGSKVSEMSADVRVLSARIDYAVISQVDDLKRRVDLIEKAQKTP